MRLSMKKLFLAVSLFVGNSVIANESNTITFKYSMDTGNYPWGMAVKKLSDTLYETHNQLQFTTEHPFSLVSTPHNPAEDPSIGMLVCDDEGNYFVLPLPFDYYSGTTKKMTGTKIYDKNFETAQIPPKASDKKPEPRIKKAPLPLRFTIYSLALIGGYQVVSKIAQFCHKQVTKTKLANVKS